MMRFCRDWNSQFPTIWRASNPEKWRCCPPILRSIFLYFTLVPLVTAAVSVTRTPPRPTNAPQA